FRATTIQPLLRMLRAAGLPSDLGPMKNRRVVRQAPARIKQALAVAGSPEGRQRRRAAVRLGGITMAQGVAPQGRWYTLPHLAERAAMLVEAVGIEPTSENPRPQASTSIAGLS